MAESHTFRRNYKEISYIKLPFPIVKWESKWRKG